uniref:BHLH domain-containing protein n=1 Tax=Kalanchoe fedtschenkoi TaxID=63787 RepID=A0A7N0RBG5_KALFE
MESAVSKTLKTLCSRYGWSVGLFWRFHHQHPMFLTLADAYEDQMGGFTFIDDLLLQVHMLGQGIIGEAALTGIDQWIHSEYQDAQTIVAIPLKSHGVVQFGSTRKIPESLEFSDQTRKLFYEIMNVQQANASANIICRNFESDQWFDSLFSDGVSTCGNQLLGPSNTSKELTQEICHSRDISHSVPSVSKMHHETMNMSCAEPEVVSSDMMSLEQLLPSETTTGSPFVFPPFPTTPISCGEANHNFQEDSPFASTYNIDELLDVENSTQFNSGQLTEDQPLNFMKSKLPENSSSSVLDFKHDIEPANWASAHPKSCHENVASRWPGPPPDSTPHDLALVTKDEHSRFSAILTSSSLNKVGSDIPVNHQGHSFQRNLTNTSSHKIPAKLSDPVSCLVQGFGSGQDVTPDMPNCPPTVSSCISGISELDAICMPRPRKGLFSELGIEQLLNRTVGTSGSVDRSRCDDPYPTTERRKTGCSSKRGSQIQSEVLSCLSDKVSSFQPSHEVAKPAYGGLEKDFMVKPGADLWIDDSYSINADSSNMTPAKRAQEITKPIKKRAKPGESTRPRPKDRQLFQDRLGELRKMIPNTGKCSIDALLDSTVKHMLFLQNVTKYAEKLQQIADQKEKGMISKNNANGVTWAFGLCEQAMICPIKVEDVGLPGQMLIEMLCDDGGSFLEIADSIRNFGLCILNGSMEDKNDKTWAHFIVEAEATRSITRVDVFWSLAQHLQQSTGSVMEPVNELPIKVMDSTHGGQSYNLHQQNVPEPITFRYSTKRAQIS